GRRQDPLVARNPLKSFDSREPGRSLRTGPVDSRGQKRSLKPGVGPKPFGAAAVIGSLVVAGAILAGAMSWLAPDSTVRSEVATPAPAAVPVEAPAAAPATTPEEPEAAAPRAFLDPAGAGATAYAAGDYETALAQYRLAVERNPQDAEAHSNLGQMLVRLERPDEALPFFDRAIALLPERWAYHFNRARALGLLDRWDEAIAGYRRALQIFPEDYATAFNLAQALHRKGDEAAAVQAYLHAIELDPTDASFRKALGISYERLQQRADAAAAYAEYLRLLPEAPDAEKVRARIAELTK
ncbi:MAG: tetratricopeptide repeat protein, partial [Vicinamibacterales bacterium]